MESGKHSLCDAMYPASLVAARACLSGLNMAEDTLLLRTISSGLPCAESGLSWVTRLTRHSYSQP